jgi:shikimate kinase
MACLNMKKYKNIYLIGLMGSGKTTLGKILSKKLDKIFYDSDQVIEEKLGVDVPMIFEYEGEVGFREREKDILQELVGKKNIVLATGGGIILSKSNRDLLSENGIVIYLKSNQKDLILRMKNDKTRPLLKNGNIEEIIKKLCKEREPLYQEIADFEIMTKNKRIHEVVNEIITIIN